MSFECIHRTNFLISLSTIRLVESRNVRRPLRPLLIFSFPLQTMSRKAAALAAAIASATHTADISYHASPSVLPSPRSSRSTPEGDILGSEREDSRSRIFHFGSPRELTGALLASHGQASTRGGCGTISISRVVGPEDRERSRLSSGGTAYSGESEPSLGAEVRGEGFADDFRVTTGTEPASDHVSRMVETWCHFSRMYDDDHHHH